MNHRKTLYGYHIRNGKLAVVSEEAAVISRIYTLYVEGTSYQRIANIGNKEQIPYSPEVPLWDKHKVKRLLENPKYTGQGEYPAILDGALFRQVQAQIKEKNAGYGPKRDRPALRLKESLRCAHCGGTFRRLAGKNRRTDTLYLKCGGCGAGITISDHELLEETARQVVQHDAPIQEAYRPSGEVVRLTNAIHRELERPSAPEQVISLILQCAAARYDCCPGPIQNRNSDRPRDVDWDHVRQAVSHITLSSEHGITVHFN